MIQTRKLGIDIHYLQICYGRSSTPIFTDALSPRLVASFWGIPVFRMLLNVCYCSKSEFARQVEIFGERNSYVLNEVQKKAN